MINIRLNEQQFKDILADSCVFRHIVMEKFKETKVNPLDGWRIRIKENFPEGGMNKIPPIKWIRRMTEGDIDTLSIFNSEGYEHYGAVLGLAAAKRFVESCF